MTRNDITEKLKNVIEMAVSSTDVDIQNCSEDTRLIEDLGLSSVGILYTVIAIE
jgi:acyl carrier protein